MLWSVPVALALASGANAHTAAFVKGMYCEVCAVSVQILAYNERILTLSF